MLAIYKHLFLQSELFVTEKRAHLLLSFIMLKNGRTYFKPSSSVSIVNFEHVIAGWVITNFIISFKITIEKYVYHKSINLPRIF